MKTTIVKWSDGTEYATQGNNFQELYINICDLFRIKLDIDKLKEGEKA